MSPTEAQTFLRGYFLARGFDARVERPLMPMMVDTVNPQRALDVSLNYVTLNCPCGETARVTIITPWELSDGTMRILAERLCNELYDHAINERRRR